MVDTHNHILFDIDDGCSNIEESIILLEKMSKIGFTKIILTPHYIKETKYISNNLEKEEKLNQLKNKLKENNINIELYTYRKYSNLGSKYFFTLFWENPSSTKLHYKIW